MIRNQNHIISASIFALMVFALMCAIRPTVAWAQGKTTTTTYTDLNRGVNVDRTTDANGNVIREKESDLQGKPLKETEREFDKDGHCTKETEKDARGDKTRETEIEYNKDGSLRKRTTRTFHPNGRKRTETIVTYGADGSVRGTTRSWDKDGKPEGKGDGETKGTISTHIESPRSLLRTVSVATLSGTVTSLPTWLQATRFPEPSRLSRRAAPRRSARSMPAN